MAGYSGTPLPKKLGIKASHRIAFIDAPANFGETLGVLPEGVEVVKQLRAPLDLIVLFVKREQELSARFEKLAAKLTPAGMLWVAWPKKASGVATDLTEGVVRRVGLDAGLVDNKVCAIDDIWSGLRFVIRLKNRLQASPQPRAVASAAPSVGRLRERRSLPLAVADLSFAAARDQSRIAARWNY